jgi:pyruvate formate lyase activating enzyme
MAGSETIAQERQPAALILDIQRMSTEDGPGLRTTVFFKGCNLSCPWCHNPESIGIKPDLTWFPQKCISCNICGNTCPQKGISRDENGIRFNRPLCLACGSCAEECPNAAIELKGHKIFIKKLATELVKDSAYFGKDGGVTLSGGEVMIQHKAALTLAQLLKNYKLHIAIDTAGNYNFSILEDMLPYIDLVLYDIKIFDSESHKEMTGADNRLILDNYKQLMDRKVKVWVRTPVIKGATDSEENIAAIGKFIAAAGLPERWELCAFNNLCRDKYERLDKEWAYKNEGLTDKEHIERLAEIAAHHVPGAVYTGAVLSSG